MSAPATRASRRKFLGASAALTLASGAVAATAAIHPDAALIVACERHPVLLAAWNAEMASTEDQAIWDGEGPAGRAYYASRDLIANARPQTMAGVLAKARAALAEDTDEAGDVNTDFTTDGSEWAWDAMNDLLRIGGAA